MKMFDISSNNLNKVLSRVPRRATRDLIFLSSTAARCLALTAAAANATAAAV